jgi:type II secretory pathway pseudopilin PulG
MTVFRVSRGGRAQGFAFLTVLIIVAVLGAGLAVTRSVWHIERRRQQEAELLYVGEKYRHAIEAYYYASPGFILRYPPSLQALLKDSRYPATRRYLRQLYPDPLGEGWEIMRAPDGGVMGVFSLSEKVPIATTLIKGARYRDWKFVAKIDSPVPPAK